MPELWPFRPMRGALETLEWMTEVLPSRTGEQRNALRKMPRQSFDLSFRLDEAGYSLAKQLARRNAGVSVYVPVWAEETQIPSIGSAASSISVDTTVADYRAGSPVLLWESNSKWEMKTVASLTGSALTLGEAVGTDLKYPFVMPVREAIVPDGFAVTRETTYNDVSAKFIVTDGIDLSGDYASAYPQYQSTDVVTDRPATVGGISDSILRSVDIIDNGFGPIVMETTKAYAEHGQTLGFSIRRNSALWARRLWAHALRGKQKAFWLPSSNVDMVMAASIGSGSTSLQVGTIGPVSFYAGKHIMIQTKAGQRYFREIISAVAGAGIDTLTLSSALGVAVAPSEVRTISFITKSRLNSDTVEFRHTGPEETTMTIQTAEVPA